MKLELWNNSEDEYGYIVEESCVKRRVFLENHTLIDGLDYTEINTLYCLYLNEITKENMTIDVNEFLFNISRDWFNIIPCVNRYVELSDYIVFNHINNNFESLMDDYSDSAERYIELFDDEGNPIILGEFEFAFRRKLNLHEKYEVKVETDKEEYLYKIRDCGNFLYIKSNPALKCDKGIIISKSAAEYLKNTAFVTEISITCGEINIIHVKEYEQKKKTNYL